MPDPGPERSSTQPVASDSPTPWWLWPNLLNLDSPMLAVIWQEQFARIAGVNLAFGDRLLLFCCTWLVYCADRVLDVVDAVNEPRAAKE